MKANKAGLYYPYVLILAWGIGCFAFFQCLYHYHFFYQEQNQIFLFSTGYLGTYFQKPAWLACMAGDFLTQFYYYLYLGPAILTVTLLTAGDLTRRALQYAGFNKHWAFAVAFIVMTIEAIFCLKTNYRLSSVIALCGGTAAYILIHWVPAARWWMKATAITVASVLTYWMFGYGLWVLQILLLFDLVCHKKSRSLLPAMLFSFMPLILLFPIIKTGHHCYYLDTTQSLSYPGIGKFSQPDFLLEKAFAVDNEYHFGNYDKVEQMVENAKPEDRTDMMLFFYNLIQAQKGELPDKLLRFTPNQLGTFYAIGPETPKLIIINMNELYWALGDMTLTERAAMMTHVFSPQNRNVRMIKRLAECNLVSGDTLAARKYLRLLQKTWVYADWAQRMTQGEPKSYRYILEKRKFANHADTVRLSDNLHLVMMQLLDSNPNNTTALDYILCSTLLLKDMENFKRDYDRYCYQPGNERIKPLYQQALMIYLAGTDAPKEEWEKYIHDPVQIKRFEEYSQQRGNPRFRDTYWYYFDTAKAPQP